MTLPVKITLNMTTTPNKIKMPPDILALRDAKPSEKLLLALYAVTEKPKRLARTLGMTKPGLRKLTRRLVEKGWLTFAGDRGILRLPPANHTVSKFKPVENGNKVTSRHVETVYDSSLILHAELVDFPHLSAAEKLVIALYAANPSATNESVANTVGLSLSGFKKVKTTLLQRRVLTLVNGVFAIRLQTQVFKSDSEGGRFITESEAIENGYKVTGPAPQLTPAKTLYFEWSRRLKSMRKNPASTTGNYAQYFAAMVQRVERESPEGVVKLVVLELMSKARDLQTALHYVEDYIPRVHQKKFVKLLNTAKPEQIAALCCQIKNTALAGQPEFQQLKCVTDIIEEHAGASVTSAAPTA